MGDVNQVVLSGRIGSISEVRPVGEDGKVVTVRLAVGYWRREEGEGTYWWDVSCWNWMAQLVEQFIKVGDKVTITGKLGQWGKKSHDGHNFEKPIQMAQITADNIIFPDRPKAEVPF